MPLDFSNASQCSYARKLYYVLFLYTEKKCQRIIDVGFIVDSSGSLRRDYGKEKEFVKIIADNFVVSKNGTRAGVITFSWHAEHSIKLRDHFTTQGFQEAVDRLPLFGHTTRIDKALNLAGEELFNPENGGRPNVQKLIILLTDGSQTKDADAIDPGDIADKIRKSGTKVIVVGIGNSVNKAELLHVANGESNLYLAKDFNELKSPTFTANIAQVSCVKGKKNIKYYL